MTTSVSSSDSARVSPRRGSPIPGRVAALTPLWLFLIMLIGQRAYWGPLLNGPPEIVGIPMGLVIAGIAGLWMLLGVWLVWDARSLLTIFLALTLFTIPATLLLIFAPGLILIMQNLGA